MRLTIALTFLLPVLASAQSPPADDPFARRGWHLELGGHLAAETWNYNISREEMYGIYSGLTYGIRDGLVLTLGSPQYYVSQRGVDGILIGVTAGVRGRVYRRGCVAAYLGFELGASESDTPLPPRGTRFNYLAIGTGGAAIRLRRGAHLLAAVRWVHVSNYSLAGRSRNPDIEAVGPHIGLLLRF